jgi:hypothetical protein
MKVNARRKVRNTSIARLKARVIYYLTCWKNKNSKVLLLMNSICSSEHRNLCS